MVDEVMVSRAKLAVLKQTMIDNVMMAKMARGMKHYPAKVEAETLINQGWIMMGLPSVSDMTDQANAILAEILNRDTQPQSKPQPTLQE